MNHFDPQVLRYISPEKIPERIAELHPGMAVTKGHHQSLVPGYIHDLEWNFYDEMHRYFVHNTYDDMYKVMAGKYFSVNIVRWGKLPIFVQVANAKITDKLFYQCMTVMGIICLHQVQRLTQKEDQVLIDINWYTASHWLFKWLHKPFNKRLLKLQKKQDLEDNVEIRGRRLDLRKRGVSFATDNPTFINSNALTDNVRLPKPTNNEIFKINLDDYKDGGIHRIDLGFVELMLCRPNSEDVEVWPAICPHEGALLNQHHLCEGIAVCPWHGRRFRKTVLNINKQTQWQFLTALVTHKGEYLEVASVDSTTTIPESFSFLTEKLMCVSSVKFNQKKLKSTA